MSRIVAPPDNHSDSDDDSGEEESSGFRIAADPNENSGNGETPAGFAVPPPKKKPSDNFIPSASFTGPKVGFIYKDGALGKGYYKDLNFSNTNSGGSAPNVPKSKHSAQKSGVDMLMLLRQKEKDEASQPRFQSIPVDDEAPEPEEQRSKGFGGLMKRFSKRRSLQGEDFAEKPQSSVSAQPTTPPPQTFAQPVPQSMPQQVPAQPSQPHEELSPKPHPRSTPVPVEQPKPQPRSTPVPVEQPKPQPRSTPVPVEQPKPQPRTQPTPAPIVSAPTTEKRAQANAGAESRLNAWCEENGLRLPKDPWGISESFSSVNRVGTTLYVSAHGPQLPTTGFVRGRVGPGGLSADQAQVAAVLTGLSILRTIQEEIGSVNNIKRLVKISGFVALTDPNDSYDSLLQMFEPIANLMVEVLGEESKPALSVAGVTVLPFNLPLQVEAIFEL
eukprot:c2335_g1_i1.p1 GENE.c2335_g1_i1~~c2335_g1_i1.p1  ORF type:complete len:443 (+),score=61.32 c2335_g1_i1:49-1377(+)